jgi:hypothetical protein
MEFLKTGEGVGTCVGIEPPTTTSPSAIRNAHESNLLSDVICLGVRHCDYSDVEADSDDESIVNFEVKKRVRKLQKGRRSNVTILDVDNIKENSVVFSLRSLARLLANKYACKGCRTVNNMTMELEMFGIASIV